MAIFGTPSEIGGPVSGRDSLTKSGFWAKNRDFRGQKWSFFDRFLTKNDPFFDPLWDQYLKTLEPHRSLFGPNRSKRGQKRVPTF